MLRYSLAAVLALAVAAPLATAGGPVKNPFTPYAAFGTAQNAWFKQTTFQAAPWYLYWPYDAHFQTSAPVFAPFYTPPTYPVPFNPYNPGFSYPMHGMPTGVPGWPVPH